MFVSDEDVIYQIKL